MTDETAIGKGLTEAVGQGGWLVAALASSWALIAKMLMRRRSHALERIATDIREIRQDQHQIRKSQSSMDGRLSRLEGRMIERDHRGTST